MQSPLEFRKHWLAAMRRAGVADFCFHDLRHTAASYPGDGWCEPFPRLQRCLPQDPADGETVCPPVRSPHHASRTSTHRQNLRRSECPTGRTPAEYEFADHLAPRGWAWEFLRRHADYRSGWGKLFVGFGPLIVKHGPFTEWVKHPEALKFEPDAWVSHPLYGTREPGNRWQSVGRGTWNA